MNEQKGKDEKNAIAPDFTAADNLLEGLREIASLQSLEPEHQIEEVKIPPFPIQVFPKEMQRIIKSTKDNLKFPSDYMGASMLSVAATAIGNTHMIVVRSGWEEACLLWFALHGKSGVNKSHPLTFALAPLFRRDETAFQKYGEQLAEYNRQITSAKEDEAQQSSKDKTKKPTLDRHVISDCTPEALAVTLYWNRRGISLYFDELAGFFKNFGRYNKGSDQEMWLSIWSGKVVIIDRKTGEPIRISFPFCGFIGTMQLGILDEMGKDGRTINGFIYRILNVAPEDVKKEYWSEAEMEPEIIESWDRIVSRLSDLPLNLDEHGAPAPTKLRFSPEAWEVIKVWQRNNTDLSNKASDDAISGIYSKLEVYVCRIALVVQMLRWASGEAEKTEVDLCSVDGAILLIEYFRSTALKIHSIISKNNPVEQLPQDKRNLYKSLPKTFTTEVGIRTAQGIDFPERTFKRFLTEKNLFEKVSRGVYEKRF